jgi:diguanylate cyclase (GGDEF)-like protein/PAS domain S-box-containing protein
VHQATGAPEKADPTVSRLDEGIAPGAPTSGLSRTWWAGGVAVAGALVALQVAVPDGLVSDWTYLTALAGSAVVALLGARRSPFRSMAVLLAVGIAISAGGDVVWQWYEWRTGVGPDVSFADVLWLGSYIAIAAALLRSPRGGRLDRDGMVDIAVVFLVALLVQWELAFDQIVTDATVPVLERFVWALYPTFDAVLLALVVRAVLSRRLQGVLGLLLGGGITLWLLSDFAYTLFASDGSYDVSLNLGWMLASYCFAAATWYRGEGAPEVRSLSERRGTEGIGHSGIAIALVPLLVPGAVAVAGHLRDEPADPFLLYGATVLLVALAFTRGARILRAETEARAALRSQERYAQAVAMNSADALAVLDEDGTILNDAPQLAALTGHHGVASVDRNAFELVAPVDAEDARAMFERCLATEGQTIEAELRIQHRQGHQLWLSARMVNLLHDPDVGGVVVNLHDISDRKRAEEALAHQAFHDGLTDLANRALFSDRVDHALARNARSGLDSAVIFLDLDGFKTVNDSLGHGAGDHLLKEVAARLTQAVRAGDTVARLGGDEFAILIEQSANPVEESEAVAERVLAALAEPIELDGQSVTVSASLGIAAGDADATAASLLRDADVAMYQAKTGGKARWVIYDPEMRIAAVERLQLENDLIGALADDQLALVYQPVVKLETEEIVGFEALLRWHHPTLGVVAPDRFIPIAEETRLIIAIGEWVLHEACGTLARWHRDHPEHHRLSMAVNVSARQIASPQLVAHVEAALDGSGIDPRSLVIEMTETALIQDTAVAATRLHQLSDLGVRLAIDDFGTGYSSLSYLRQFPVEVLKIDKSFISTITDRKQVPAIVRGLLDLGHTLGLETLAEGVEHGVQRDRLRGEQCDLAQGYLFSRPLDAADAELLLVQLAPRPLPAANAPSPGP